MLNLKLKERRLNTRKRLTGLLPGRLMLTESEKNINCRPVDISKDGLGILSEELLDIGTKISLVGQDININFEIRWSKRDFGKHDLFRYGLATIDDWLRVDLEFQRAGCLK